MKTDVLSADAVAGSKWDELIWVNPKEILPSPFGDEVNIPLSPEARKALEASITEEKRVRVPLFCGRNKNGKLQVICGTNRLIIAQRIGLETVPVIIVEFESVEEMRQFAIKDNAQRRQLSANDLAHQGYRLWKSFEAEKVKGSRRQAADATGVSEGTLANFAYVMDSGFQDIIDAMLSGALKIHAAYTMAKARIDAEDAPSVPTPMPVKLGRLEADLRAVTDVFKVLGALTDRVASLSQSVGNCGAAEKRKLLKQFRKYQEAFRNAKTEGRIDKILDALESVEIALV